MWINKEKYELMNHMAKNNEHDANLLRGLIHDLKEYNVIIHSEFIMMSPEAYRELSNKLCLCEDKYKKIEAELEWYKVKYHEMKTNKDATNTRSIFEHCMDCGNHGWDMPQCRECSAENNYKYFVYRYNDKE